MKAKTMPTDDSLKLFKEEDWSFLNPSHREELSNLTYFGDLKDENTSSLKSILLNLVYIAIVTMLLITAFLIYWKIWGNTLFSPKVKNEVVISSITYLEGNDVADKDYIDLTQTITDYFNFMKDESSLTKLNSLCVGSSILATTESTYRNNITYSYDINDCYSRSIRRFGTYVTLERVNKIIEKEGIYYCYITLNSPYTYGLSEYFSKYASDMTKYFKTNRLDKSNVTKYLLQTIANGDLPTYQKEYLFTLQNSTGVFKIIDDTQIKNICLDSYSTSVTNIISQLGGNLVTEQYKN